MTKIKIFYRISGAFLFISVTTQLLSCKDYYRNKTHKEMSLSSIKDGEDLAKKYCQSCHQLPEPLLLDTKSWENGVLPQMGPRLGIFVHNSQTYPTNKGDMNLDPDFYPSKPLIKEDEWQNIINYYIATSPDSLAPQKRVRPIKMDLPLFSVQQPVNIYDQAATAFIKINKKDSLHPLIVSDIARQNIYFINKKLELKDSVSDIGSVVNIDLDQDKMLACNIGIINPNNGSFGNASIIYTSSNDAIEKDKIKLFNNLQRPVQITEADINKDGLEDYLICEFGNLDGELSWMENIGNNKFTQHILRAVPGAIKAYIQDYNHDGLPDIWVLFAQGNEGIFLFTNKGNGNFTQEQVLQFPPVNGSSYFELTDFDKDGYPDILYTCGDNADFSLVLKPYHGVYIFMNDKTNHFKQKYFFPINGCYKAIARDFDNDGDLDIATISFFADYSKQPEEGFVYLKNTGNFDFEPFSLPEAKLGRWLTMDADDLDGDGKIDIVLGNFSIRPSAIKSAIDWKKSPPFILLKNTGK